MDYMKDQTIFEGLQYNSVPKPGQGTCLCFYMVGPRLSNIMKVTCFSKSICVIYINYGIEVKINFGLYNIIDH